MKKQRKVSLLAIETSADETSAAVLTDGKLRSNIIYSQIAVHRKTGGIVPEVAARNHILKILPVIRQALAQAGVHLREIDAIAVTIGPGLVTSLRIGVDTAKALAFALNKPIIPINHLEGHLLSALPITYKLSPKTYFPALGLIVSGGHTMLVLIKKIGQYKIIGETVDDAAGECFDKVAKLLGLPYPGGPALAKLAEQGNPRAFDLPRPMLDRKNYDFSFSGLKTAVLYLYNDVIATPTQGRGKQSRDRHGLRPRDDKLRADIAASLERAIVDVLVAKTIRAAREYKVKTILLGGGVAANKKLRHQLKAAIKKFFPNSKFLIPNSSLTTDNAGMIALAASYHYRYRDLRTFDQVKANPNLELKSWR